MFWFDTAELVTVFLFYKLDIALLHFPLLKIKTKIHMFSLITFNFLV